MAGEAFRRPQFPWCTVVLVLSVLACQTCVLVGNIRTAEVMSELGRSTGGWSRVGLGVGKSLQLELDATMNNVSLMLLDGMKHVEFVQETLDGVLSLVGSTTDEAIGNSTQLSLLQREGPAALALLQEREGNASANSSVDQLVANLAPAILSAVHNVLMKVSEKVSTALQDLMAKIKPALLQIGKWIVTFGDKIQAGIDVFSVTLDMVQKLFDKLMSQLNGKGGNEDQMLGQTFNLFDMKQDGYITVKDLQFVAELYSITALQGNLSQELVTKYDTSGDGQLGPEEMLFFVNDPAIPNSMSVLLRTYARRMAEISGNVAAARQRDEVAYAVVQYFSLACAKNMTKVAWVAQRLTNNTLPREFTATVLVQLCLTEDDPNKFTKDSVGEVVVAEMFRLNASSTLASLDQLSNTTFWETEGFNLQEQPLCLKRVTGWVTGAANTSRPQVRQALFSAEDDGFEAAGPSSLMELASMLGGDAEAAVDMRVLQALPETARRLAEESVSLHLLERQRQQQCRHRELFGSTTSRLLLSSLLGGVSVKVATSGPSSAQQATKSGQMARPETLQFAQWLAYNASVNAKEKQAMCFDYSSESSSAMDSFATQIQGMVSQMQGFLDMMTKYATPAGIEQLEETIEGFVDKGMNDMMAVVETRLVSLVNTSAPKLDGAIHHAAQMAGEKLGRAIGQVMGNPLGQAMVPVMKEVVGQLTNQSDAAKDVLGEELGKELGNAVANLTSEALAKEAGKLVEDLVDAVLTKGTGAAGDLFRKVSEKLEPQPKVALLQGLGGLYHSSQTSRRLREQLEAFRGDEAMVMSALEADMDLEDFPDNVADAISGAWHGLVNTLRSLVNTLPTAVSTLKFARREVSKLSSNLDSIFEVFEEKGTAVFENIARFYRDLWVAYFILLLPLNMLVLYYAFWAGGYFGGPMPFPEEEEETEQPKTFREKCAVCLSSCFLCLQKQHDTSLCFWSVVIFMQVIVLLVFIASIVLCILAGVKAFILAGCQQIYVLADDTICTEALGNLRSFLETFLVTDSMVPLASVCQQDSLLTCQIIRQKMVTSSTLTTVFSLLATVLSLQLILDSAVLHEQARWRRMAHALFLKEAASREDAAERVAA